MSQQDSGKCLCRKGQDVLGDVSLKAMASKWVRIPYKRKKKLK
jgi:hypothetical protein